MNKDNLIPIDFSRNITPFVLGDELYNASENKPFKIHQQQQVDVFNSGVGGSECYDSSSYFVVSFADRPNTGEQPVGDDVVVDCQYTLPEDDMRPDKACKYHFGIDGDKSSSCLIKWKPNHAAMLKQWQAEQAKEWPSCDSQEDIGPGVEAGPVPEELSQADALKKLIYACDGLSQEYRQSNYGDAKKWLRHIDSAYQGYENAEDEPASEDKPAFTQAMADAGELPMVGSLVLIKYLPYHGDDYGWFEHEVYGYKNGKIICDHSEVSEKVELFSEWKPIQTAEEKLKEALSLAVNEPISTAVMVERLLASDKFTITLKGE